MLAACGSKDPSNNRASKQFSNLAEGKHTFRVRARDGGDIDATTLVRTWTVDTVAPTATLSTATGPGEGALQAVDREPFTFSADEDATFQCRLDGAEFAACASGIVLENLTAGAHRFEVRAVDAAGNVAPPSRATGPSRRPPPPRSSSPRPRWSSAWSSPSLLRHREGQDDEVRLAAGQEPRRV